MSWQMTTHFCVFSGKLYREYSEAFFRKRKILLLYCNHFGQFLFFRFRALNKNDIYQSNQIHPHNIQNPYPAQKT